MTTFNGILHSTAHSTQITLPARGTTASHRHSNCDSQIFSFISSTFRWNLRREKGWGTRYSFRYVSFRLRCPSCLFLVACVQRRTKQDLHENYNILFTYCFRKSKEPIEQIVVICSIIDEFHYIHTCICLRLHGRSSWIMDYEPKMPEKKIRWHFRRLTEMGTHTHALALKDDTGYRL